MGRFRKAYNPAMESTTNHVDTCPFNVLSLCSGVGGLDLGVRLAVPRARTICYVEREIAACEVLAARMGDQTLDEAPIWTDLKTFDGKPWRGAVHCVTAGYPCQPFSVMGQKGGVGDPRHLWPDVARIVRETGAGIVFIENVPNHLNIGFSSVREELCGLGYRVEAGLFSAAEVGAPHLRQRLFAMGYSKSRSVELPGCLKGDEVQARGCGIGMDREGEEPPESQRPFPPKPRQYRRWAAVLEKAPSLKPGFLDLADELASGVADSDAVDKQTRIRLVGNGVVPSCAAYAFSILGQRIGLEN